MARVVTDPFVAEEKLGAQCEAAILGNPGDFVVPKESPLHWPEESVAATVLSSVASNVSRNVDSSNEAPRGNSAKVLGRVLLVDLHGEFQKGLALPAYLGAGSSGDRASLRGGAN